MFLAQARLAPTDKCSAFYLILDVAVGGTNGWFPDSVGDKPWLDQSSSAWNPFTPTIQRADNVAAAMYDFARAQDTWYATWPTDTRQRGMAVDYVKMWQLC